jgi:hypothetical protein
MGMIHNKKLLILFAIPTTILLVLVSLLADMLPRQFVWLRCIAGLWIFVYLVSLRYKIMGYKGVSSIMVIVLLAAMLILGLWLIPLEIVGKSVLRIVGIFAIVAVWWDQRRISSPKTT